MGVVAGVGISVGGKAVYVGGGIVMVGCGCDAAHPVIINARTRARVADMDLHIMKLSSATRSHLS